MSISSVNQILQVASPSSTSENSLGNQIESELFKDHLSQIADAKEPSNEIKDRNQEIKDLDKETEDISNQTTGEEQNESIEIEESPEVTNSDNSSESDEQETDEVDLSEEAAIAVEFEVIDQGEEGDLQNNLAVVAVEQAHEANGEAKGETSEEEISEVIKISSDIDQGIDGSELGSETLSELETEVLSNNQDTQEGQEQITEAADRTVSEGQDNVLEEQIGQNAKSTDFSQQGFAESSIALPDDLVDEDQNLELAEEFELQELENAKPQERKEASKASIVDPESQQDELVQSANDSISVSKADVEVNDVSTATPSASGIEDLEKARTTNRNNNFSQTTAADTENTDPNTGVDRARFVQRVSGAFRAAQQRDGEIRLRLSPPELGALRIEIAVKQGALTAKMETETSAARNLLLDNLPALRERLAEQEITIEKFDVDVRDESSNQSDQAETNKKQSENRESGKLRNTPEQQESDLEASQADSVEATKTIVSDDSLDVMI